MKLHNHLENRTEITGIVVLETAIHIGTSQQVGRSDAPVIRTQFGDAFIPGASLKGSLRSKVESLAHVLSDETWVCFLKNETDESGRHQCLSPQRTGASEIQKKAKDASNEELAAYLEQNLCASCQLFGGASWRSKVLLDDLHLEKGYKFPTELRDGVGIDRDSHKAVNHVKYNFEAVPAGSRFKFRLIAENLGDRDWALLAMGLLEMVNGHLTLGGKTTRGLGSTRLENLAIKTSDFTKKKEILSYFSAKPVAPISDPKEWLLKQLENYLQEGENNV